MKRITCVVDNSAMRASDFWAEHGISFRIQIGEECALFDTGSTSSVLLHNLGLLEDCPRGVQALILSHAHTDHSGGLAEFLPRNPGLSLYASPHIFDQRNRKLGDYYKPIGMVLTRQELAGLVDVRLHRESVEVIPGLWTTGEIRRRLEPEGRSARHFVPDGSGWAPDPYEDDLSLVMKTRTGLVVICGCCHAGLLNTLAQVRETFDGPVEAILGGTHLMEADEAHLQHVVEVLRDDFVSPCLFLNHCTGEKAFIAMSNAFGEKVQACPAGTVLEFE